MCDNLRDALLQEEAFFKQKSRINWLEKGDGNNGFFFNSCKNRWNCNKILSLNDENGVTQTTHKAISDIAVGFFKNLLGTSSETQPIPDNIVLPTLSVEQQSHLCTPFSPDEVLCCFKNMAKNKSPGPDGFTTEFFISSWATVGPEVTNGVLYFFSSLNLPKIINATALALVPKQENPTKMNHFRPISCCNVLYKCVSTMLACRLKNILNKLISPSQSAFISKSSIGDNIERHMT